MPRKSPFKHHRFPRDVILCAVHWYLRYPLSYQGVVDLLAERGITVDRFTVCHWVQKFIPELAKRTEQHLRRASVDWHVDETYIQVGGRWRYLWRAVDANGQMVDLRLTAPFCAKQLSVCDCIAQCPSAPTRHKAIGASSARSITDTIHILTASGISTKSGAIT